VVEKERIIRGNDPSFRPATTKREFFFAKGPKVMAWERTEDGGRARVQDVNGGVEASGAQAKKQRERWWWRE